MKTFEELFNEITDWQDKQFGQHNNPIPSYNHFIEEVQEIGDELNKANFRTPQLKTEIADGMMLLIGMYKRAFPESTYKDMLIDLGVKLWRNKRRKWGKPNKLGIVKAVKESC